jgi:hypothetical protein
MPCLRSMAQMTVSVQAVRLAMMTLMQPDLPDPVVPPARVCRRRNSTVAGVASSNGPRLTGWVIVVTGWPGQGIASACGSLSRTRSSNRWARLSGVG